MVSKAPESIISAAIASLKALLASPINYNSFIFYSSQLNPYLRSFNKSDDVGRFLRFVHQISLHNYLFL